MWRRLYKTGFGLTTGFIGFQYSYTQFQRTHYSRPSHEATLQSSGAMASQRVFHCTVSAESRQGPGPSADPILLHWLFSEDCRLKYWLATDSTNIAWGRTPKKTPPRNRPKRKHQSHCCRCQATASERTTKKTRHVMFTVPLTSNGCQYMPQYFHVLMTRHEGWIEYWIYWILITLNYKYLQYSH
jgi:hypothetical protein